MDGEVGTQEAGTTAATGVVMTVVTYVVMIDATEVVMTGATVIGMTVTADANGLPALLRAVGMILGVTGTFFQAFLTSGYLSIIRFLPS